MIATGFLRSYAKVGYREKDNPQFRYEYLDDMIGTIGRGVLGLTVNCARCHNHKFDPISQKDYYRMQASLFGYVETDYPLAPKEQAEAYEKKTAEIDAQVAPSAAAGPPARRALSRSAWRRRSTRSIPPTCSGPSRLRKRSARPARRCWPAR